MHVYHFPDRRTALLCAALPVHTLSGIVALPSSLCPAAASAAASAAGDSSAGAGAGGGGGDGAAPNFLACCAWDKSIQLWRAQGVSSARAPPQTVMTPVGVFEGALVGHRLAVQQLAVCGGGALASGSHDTTIKVWHVASRQLLYTARGHHGPVTALLPL